jgi:chitin disaccharide deacetylase
VSVLPRSDHHATDDVITDAAGTKVVDAVNFITRGDDAGLCVGTNLAMVDACREGIIRNVSILAVGSAAAHAVEVLSPLEGVALGLHATLTCEWLGSPWGPVSDPTTIPSIVNTVGRFPPTITDVPTHATTRDVEREVRAQLKKLRSLGARLTYIDDHMAFAWHPRIKELMHTLAASEGLIFGDTTLHPLPQLESPAHDPVETLCRRIAEAPPGCHLLILHPSMDAPDINAFCLPEELPGVSAGWRVIDYTLSRHPDVIRTLRRRRINLLRYDQARPILSSLSLA